MIVPRSRLMWWTALIVLPFSILGAVVPSALWIAAGFIGALAALALGDAVAGRRSLAGLSLQLPPLLRWSKDRAAAIELRIRNERPTQRRLRIALSLPGEIKSALEVMDVLLPREGEWSRVNWVCQPLKRGRYELATACLEGPSPLGLWGVRSRVPAVSEIRVYPNLLLERRNLAALFLNRGPFGLHAQRQVGQGRDFEKLREYTPGDGYDEIHWKATARRGRPITKVFQIERTQEVYVVIDSSRLSARSQTVRVGTSAPGGTPAASGTELPRGAVTTVLERYVTAALVLAQAAARQGDLFGLLTFADRVGTFVRARNGREHYQVCRDALYTVQPGLVSPDFDEVCTFIRLRLRRRALVVFLTSLDDPTLAASFQRNLDLICGQHLVLVGMLQPPGVFPLFSRADVTRTDDLFQHLGAHLRWQKLGELGKALQRRGVRFSLVENEKLSAEVVSQYMGIKQRQLL